MRSFFTILLLVSEFLVSTPAQGQEPYESDSSRYVQIAGRRPPTHDNEKKIDDLVRQMTIEEKVGQMTQLTIQMVTNGRDQNSEIDEQKLERAVIKYGVGSILNVFNQALTLEHWHRIISRVQEFASRTRLKVPVLYGIDSIHGANYVQGATLFPQDLGMAATWDPELMQRSAEIAAMETRAAGIPWSFSPVLDVGRQPMWPRLWETFGEDPYLATVMGTAYVRGLEGDDVGSGKHVAACLKHYVGYSFPLTGRDRTPALIPEHTLREYFLPTFAAAVKAGAQTVMVNSGEVNGVPGHINKYLITDVLKGELGFDGFVVSDWEDIKKLVTQWHVAADEKEATRLAVMAGIDMSMVPASYSFSDNLAALVKENKVPVSRIDDAVRRILRVKFRTGLFASAMPDPRLRTNFGKAEYTDAALRAARESITLLRNEHNILPLRKDQKILVTGPTADSLISLNNGWSYVWQGSEPSLYPADKPTLQSAIRGKLAAQNVIFVPGTRIVRKAGSPSNNNPTSIDEEVDIPAAVAEARRSDVVVLALGEGSYTESPGNIDDLTLPQPQLKLAEALIATGRPVVVVLIEGRPRIISRIADKVDGILMAYNPGNEGGRAIADVLFGEYDPSGKLPITYPRSPGYFGTYDAPSFGNSEERFSPQFPFGHGLSYTTFRYDDLRLSPKSISAADKLDVSFRLTNTGTRAGYETAIVYVRDEVASLTPAARRVRRFAKVFLQPGESRKVNFTLDRSDLSFVDATNKTVVEPGEFTVMVGGLSETFTLRR